MNEHIGSEEHDAAGHASSPARRPRRWQRQRQADYCFETEVIPGPRPVTQGFQFPNVSSPGSDRNALSDIRSTRTNATGPWLDRDSQIDGVDLRITASKTCCGRLASSFRTMCDIRIARQAESLVGRIEKLSSGLRIQM